MLKVKIGNEEFEFTNAEDLLIGKYEDLSSILNSDKLDEIERFYQAFVMLGMDGDLLDSIDGFSFLKIIREFKDVKMDVSDMEKSIILNGRTYESYQDEFFFSVKDMKMIESAVKKNSTHFIADIMAIIFKDVELTKVEHYEPAHIKYKAKLIRENITYKVALPFISSFSKQLIENLEQYKND